MDILTKIASENDLSLLESKPLSGGDINEVFLLKCASKYVVAKTNDANEFPGMFEAEAKGLDLLRASKSFKIPSVIGLGIIENTSYLLLKHIKESMPITGFWEQFASNLSKLHKTTQAKFGLDHNNYIGSLPQYNGKEHSAADFYINQRLEPQFKMAKDRGFGFHNLNSFYKNILSEIPNEPSSLIHGDLWGGNYMVSENSAPTLIDPAVSFAPREMDLAMMQLFGGFSETVFPHYHERFPLKEGWKQRTPLWQLYYLLVHLNLFGSGYLSRVQSIVKKYQ
ncbi:fructosamine kinase family protein [Marixanthomonas spongiae]|uniref:Fructosamine kinase n=1 Tax=Marixanthomonas spongiae TaxID=2174845 RepID=A0A2U0I7V1_9FLAO|nr:fructosamine kinase family protein [Marixanthomonas spongiae]PVW17168.1 fructosamine kinase [Marixanthomonas spongiae]